MIVVGANGQVTVKILVVYIVLVLVMQVEYRLSVLYQWVRRVSVVNEYLLTSVVWVSVEKYVCCVLVLLVIVRTV